VTKSAAAPATSWQIRLAEWPAEAEQIRAVRERVFVQEQGVPAELEWDEFDAQSEHVLMWHETNPVPVATARLLNDGHIGRMAVLLEYRGQGMGATMLRFLMQRAQERGMQELVLHAQTHAQNFYARAGFVQVGAEFMEAGIPHVRMVRRTDGAEA